MKQAARLIKLSAEAPQTVRFLSGLHVHLEEGKNSSWVTLTRTGKFSDPRYGTFEITREMLLSMVKNFEANVVGQEIFADVSHRPEMGSAGTFKTLKVEGDRLRALVEWTPYGIEAIQTKGYKYFSVEYHENWKDNEQNISHGCTLLGAGLTTRPVIKRLDPVVVELSEATGDTPIFLHPELQSQLLKEQSIMWKQKIEALQGRLGVLKLAEAVILSLVMAATKSLASVTDEAAGDAIIAAFDDSGKKLAQEIGDKNVQLSIQVPSLSGALTAEDVKKLMQEETAKQATEAKKLADQHQANIKLLADTIGAVQGFDEETKKQLAHAVQDLITPEMSAEQIKKLAENQIKHGAELQAARKLANLGFAMPQGHVHIQVDSSNEIKALQEAADKRCKLLGRSDRERFSRTGGQLQEANKTLAESALAVFDNLHARRLHAEHKMLAAGDGIVSDVAVPAIFERTVLREALYNLVGLQFVDAGVETFSAQAQIPYSFRDTTAAGRSGTRTYEGQAIRRAGVRQTSETAYIIPQKLAFEVSDELRYLTSNGQLNWDVVAENAINATRIIAEDTEQLIFDEQLNASDQFATTAVTNEAVGTGNGTRTIYPVAQFPVVRPKRVYDLAGAQVGSTLYGITVTTNAVNRLEYDGTGTQAAGTYWIMNHNLGELTFVNELGVPTAVPNTHAIVASYTYTTNVSKFDTDQGSVATDIFWDNFLYRYSLRKNIIESDRYYSANFGLMSGTVMTQIEQARSFVSSFGREGSTLDTMGNLGTVKGVPNFKTTAPGLAMGDQRVIIGERNLTRYRVAKPWAMGEMQNQTDANGRFTGKKEAYGDQFIFLHTPTQLKAGLTSIVLYSATARVAR